MAKRSHDIGSVDRAVVCLIAEDNPISAKILETLLVRLGCRCVIACDGAEAISTAHGDISEWSLLWFEPVDAYPVTPQNLIAF